MYETNRAESIAKIASLVDGFRVAMLVTRAGDGSLRARPMATTQAPFDGTLWFFTGHHTAKVLELAQEPSVGVVYADPARHRFVSLSGRGELVHDPDRARELWKPAFREWLPNGLEDPELALLKVGVERAEYWDSPGVINAVGTLFAGFSGDAPPPSEGDEDLHRTVVL